MAPALNARLRALRLHAPAAAHHGVAEMAGSNFAHILDLEQRIAAIEARANTGPAWWADVRSTLADVLDDNPALCLDNAHDRSVLLDRILEALEAMCTAHFPDPRSTPTLGPLP